MPLVAPAIDDIIENLCHEGCKAVHLYIQQLEQNNPVELLEGLGEEEISQVLKELRAIMAIYDRCNNPYK